MPHPLKNRAGKPERAGMTDASHLVDSVFPFQVTNKEEGLLFAS